jgi:hypothetical protein
MNLPARRRYALLHPLETVFGGNVAEYAQIVHKGKLRLSTVLTVTRHESGYRWHASVSILDSDGKPIPFFGNAMSEEFETAMNYAVEMVDDVGTGEISTIKPDAVIHLFKNLSGAELRSVSKFSSARNN